MISSAVSFVMLLVTFTLAQEYLGITRQAYVPGPTPLIQISDLPCRFSPGIRTTIAGNRPISPVRFIIGASEGLLPYMAGTGQPYTAYQTDTKQSGTCNESVGKAPEVQLRGLQLLRLTPFTYSRQGMLTRLLLGTSETLSEISYSIPDESKANTFQNRIRAGEALSWQGYTAIPRPQSVRMSSGNGRTVNGRVYLQEYARQLKLVQFPFEDLILARSSGGVIYPIALSRFGESRIAYAVYGVWHDEASARRFGFHAGDIVFPTDHEVLPDVANGAVDTKAWPMFVEAPVDIKLRYGRQVLSLEQVLADPENNLPRLIWRSIPTWSDMNKRRDKDLNLLANTDGFYPPTAPDDPGNDNPLPFIGCPDRDWYFSLYAQCVALELGTDEYNIAHPNNFTDFKDYLSVKLMENYDASIYHKDKSLSTQYATTENPPDAPFLFNKDGDLLNREPRRYSDPWDPATHFYLQYREGYWDWGVWKHRHQDRDLTSEARSAVNTCVDVFNKTQNDLNGLLASTDVKVKWADETLKDSALYLGNPIDYFNNYKSEKEFCIYDNNYVLNGGNPFKTISPLSSGDDEWIGVKNQDNEKDWYVVWEWTLVYRDKADRKWAAAKVTLRKYFYHEQDMLMAAGQEEGGSTQNNYFKLDNPDQQIAEFDKYDKNSKDYATDQSDISARNKKVDKGEALLSIGRKIAVAEGLNFMVKALYAQSDNQYVAAAYEGVKRVENTLAMKKSYNLAMRAYQAYVLWAQTMDVLAEVRDTYQSIGPAWDGLLSSIHNVYSYYRNLDFSSIRLTNITKLLPEQALFDLDWHIYSLQSSLVDFNLAIDGLAFQTDRFSGGNYGPFNPYINLAYAELAQAAYTSGSEASHILKASTTALDASKNGSRNSSSDAAYLSNLTRATHNILINQNLKIMNERNRSMALGLFIVEREARDWVAFKRHMKNVYSKTPGDLADVKDKQSFMGIVSHYRDPGLFQDVESWNLQKADE